MKNLKKLARKELSLISGGDVAYAICDQNGICPRVPSGFNSYCSNGICYRASNGGGGGNPGCTEPQHLCESWETGCGCVYI